MHSKRQTILQVAIIIIGLAIAAGLTRWFELNRPPVDKQIEEESLYVSANKAKRMSLGFNGLVADWYWMRSLQYVGRKIVASNEPIQLDDMRSLNLKLLHPMLDTATTLDPQFMAAYEYGGIVLPAINPDDAVKLLHKGIKENPNAWILHHHLGYIHWKRGDYQAASEAYSNGAKIQGAPSWMLALSALMKSKGGSREVARLMYYQIYEQTKDENIKLNALSRLMQLDSFDELDAIRKAIGSYKEKNNRCPGSWRDLFAELRNTRLPNGSQFHFNALGIPIDPSESAYILVNNGCEVRIDWKTSKILRD
jgi:tetratricopeptide (TPR) repeat protein